MEIQTKPEIEAARSAVALMGGPVKTAVTLQLSRYQTVQSWLRIGVPVQYCAAIERCTNKQVNRQMLRPHDWQRIWPELADQPTAGQGT